MRTSSVAYDYAKVFYEVCKEENIIDDILYEYKTLIRLNNEELHFFLMLPTVNNELKKNLIDNLDTCGLSKIVINLIKILIDNGELELFGQIIDEYQNLYQIDNDIKIIDITLAADLESKQINDIRINLENKFKKFIVLRKTIDPKILGGIKIEYDGKVIDNSIIKQINNLNKEITK